MGRKVKFHQRAYCYYEGKRTGYATPLRDSIFRKPWGWIVCDMTGTRLGTAMTLAEAKMMCYEHHYRRNMVCE